MILIDLLFDRAQQVREFILLPWEVKKKRIREFWEKYGRLYIILFVLCTIVAFINVYLEWSTTTTSKTTTKMALTHKPKSHQIGGLGPNDGKTDADTTATKAEEPAKNEPPIAKNEPTAAKNEPVAAKNEPVAAKNEPAAAKNEPAAAKNESAAAKNETANDAGKNTAKNQTLTTSGDKKDAASNKPIINQNITNINNTTNDTDNNIKNNNSKKQEIRERRLAKQAQRQQQSSLSDTLGSVGNNISGALTGGVGKALSALGTFFSAILGLILFCAAPVVIFYLWMKKLILPLFPTR